MRDVPMPTATVVADYGDGLMDVELANEPGQLWRARLIPRPGVPAWVCLTRLGKIDDMLDTEDWTDGDA